MALIDEEQFKKEIITDPFFGDAVRFILSKLGDMRGKVIFDSGCGAGVMSVFFALQGATVIGIDRDSRQLAKAVDLATSFGVNNNCFFLMANSEECPIDSDSIDIVFSRSALQYMERDKVFEEYFRILKPDGSLALIENLPYSPLINIYRFFRYLTARTKDQKEYVKSIKGYIDFNDINRLGDRFDYKDQKFFHLFRIISIYLTLFVKNPSSSKVVRILDKLLSSLDNFLLLLIPVLNKTAWFAAIYYKKLR